MSHAEIFVDLDESEIHEDHVMSSFEFTRHERLACPQNQKKSLLSLALLIVRIGLVVKTIIKQIDVVNT